jgi:Endonuclease/Exonuclease/phosphatase family
VRSKRGLLNLLATAFVVTFLVVGAGALAAPGNDRAELIHSVPPAASPAASPSAAATKAFNPYVAPKVGYAVTLTAKPKARPKHKLPKPKVAPKPPPSLDFVISSFNVLGASHTAGGGTHARYASGRVRAHYVASLLASHGVDVVGMQELQGPQLSELLRVAGGTYDFYPGFSLGTRGTDDSIAWRKDMWEPVSLSTVQIPYFNGRTRPMPYVLLKNRATGLEAYFANFHNPASVPRYRNQQHWRDRATADEVALTNGLMHDSGIPVFVTGDMNERAEYFCKFTGGTAMIAAHGGSNNGRCLPPRARAVDWIFGSLGVTFTDYIEDRSPLVLRTTDHPVIVSHAQIGGIAAH